MKKSHFLLYNVQDRVRDSFPLTCGGAGVLCRRRTRLLGFEINDKLTWEKHVTHICKKNNEKIYHIAPFVKRLSQHQNVNDILLSVHFLSSYLWHSYLS